MGILQFPQKNNLWDMKPNTLYKGSGSSVSINPLSSVELFSVVGAGILGGFELALIPTPASHGFIGAELVIDGVAYNLYDSPSNTIVSPAKTGYYRTLDGGNNPSIMTSQGLFKFKTHIKLYIRNSSTVSAHGLSQWSFAGVYYT